MCSFAILVIDLRAKKIMVRQMYCSIYFSFSHFYLPNLFQKNVSIQKISIYELQEKPLQFITFPTIIRKVFLLFPLKYLLVMH